MSLVNNERGSPQGIFLLSTDRFSMKQKATGLSAVYSSHRGWSDREADQGKSGWLWPSEEVLHQHWGNPALPHLCLKTGGESPHKHRVQWQGPKARRGLLAGCVKLSNRAEREKIWDFTISRIVHRSVTSVKGPLLRGWNSLYMIKLEKSKSIMYCSKTPWLLSLKHIKQTNKKNPLRATATMFVHSYTAQIQPN